MINTSPYIEKLNLLREYMDKRIDGFVSDGRTSMDLKFLILDYENLGILMPKILPIPFREYIKKYK